MSVLCQRGSAETEKAVSRLAQNVRKLHLYIPWTKASTGTNWPHATNTGGLPLYLLISYQMQRSHPSKFPVSMHPNSSLISGLTASLCKMHVHRQSVSKLPTQQQKLKCNFYSSKDLMKLCLMVCRLHFYMHLQCSH